MRCRGNQTMVGSPARAKLAHQTVKSVKIPEGVEVHLDAEEGLDMILDATKIHRALDNLIRNAVEAMPQGGRLKILARRGGDDAVIQVRDTGIGIPDEEIPNLFKPFHTTKAKGMGLGLAYRKRAVEAQGGSIAMESKVGEGTTFMITLPAKASVIESEQSRGRRCTSEPASDLR